MNFHIDYLLPIASKLVQREVNFKLYFLKNIVAYEDLTQQFFAFWGSKGT
ncbi:hypothetical protein LEP1GSC058_1044 [Leptospira fainei serovar Hurstbridge str. BUT 6]|uniref:Uncharacterized protein n=1 Tax=Leptospira fainei serovar Hurstbridge str. BUT 6 TaxID=1193011 RepID=S3UW00_9LEPT|nr:hypothetical protein LEP1GSC058_1044 [Leptospira fainei serovar Hurstbridge str. BUT 6]